jgi:hypothetical protein
MCLGAVFSCFLFSGFIEFFESLDLQFVKKKLGNFKYDLFSYHSLLSCKTLFINVRLLAVVSHCSPSFISFPPFSSPPAKLYLPLIHPGHFSL